MFGKCQVVISEAGSFVSTCNFVKKPKNRPTCGAASSTDRVLEPGDASKSAHLGPRLTLLCARTISGGYPLVSYILGVAELTRETLQNFLYGKACNLSTISLIFSIPAESFDRVKIKESKLLFEKNIHTTTRGLKIKCNLISNCNIFVTRSQ